MTKAAFTSAQSADNRVAKVQWKELVNILEKNYSIKSINKDEVFLNIPGEEKADIEISLLPASDEPFKIQLWYFKLNSNNSDDPNRKSRGSLTGTIMAIDEFLNAVKLQKKYG